MNNAELTNCLCENAYKQGIEDMKEIILTIEQMYDNSDDDNDNDLLAELFGCSHDNYRMIFDNFTVSEIQDKIKHYKQLTEVPIQIGDVVKHRKADNPINLLVIAIGNSDNPHLAYCNVMDSKGNDLPNWRDKVIELYGENYMERD